MGDYVTTLAPFSIPALGGAKVGGMIVGWLGILLYQQDTPADAVAAGHQALAEVRAEKTGAAGDKYALSD